MLGNLKDEYPHLKIAQWFLDPLNKNGPDFSKIQKKELKIKVIYKIVKSFNNKS